MVARDAALDLAQRAARSEASTSSSLDEGPARLTAWATSRQVPGHFLGVDYAGRLAEVGWEMMPVLMHVAWAGQWLDYSRRLQARLGEPVERQVRIVSFSLS